MFILGLCSYYNEKELHNLTVGMSVSVNVNNNILKSLFGRHNKLRMKRKKSQSNSS